jgi:phage terminase small subunit
MLSIQEKRFCDKYIIHFDLVKAVKEAGFQVKNKARKGMLLLERDDIKKYIKERVKLLECSDIATEKEVLIFLTSVLRGEATENLQFVSRSGSKDGFYEEILEEICSPKLNHRLRAAEYLLKLYSIANDITDDEKLIINNDVPKTNKKVLN